MYIVCINHKYRSNDGCFQFEVLLYAIDYYIFLYIKKRRRRRKEEEKKEEERKEEKEKKSSLSLSLFFSDIFLVEID